MFLFNVFIPFYFFCLFYVLGIAFDLIATKIALSKGLSEGNPLLAKFKNPVLVSAIGSLATIIFAIIAASIESTTAHASLFCLIFATYRFALGVLNTIKIIKKGKK